MIKSIILGVNLVLLGATNVVTNSYPVGLAKTSSDDGHVSSVMENLAVHTATVTNEVFTQLVANTEHTAASLKNNIELIIASALNQLQQPMENFQRQIAISQCQPAVAIQELTQQIESDLSKCTQDFNNILNILQQDVMGFKADLEENVQAIKNLPENCKHVEGGFGSSINCYINSVAEFNKQISGILSNAVDTITNVRQMGEEAVQEARSCARNVIGITLDNLQKTIADCQLALEDNN